MVPGKYWQGDEEPTMGFGSHPTSLEAGHEGSIRGDKEGEERAKQNHVSLYHLNLVYQRSFQNRDLVGLWGEEA